MVDIKKIKQKTAQIKSSMEDKPTIYKAPYIPIAKRETKAQKFNEKEYKTSPEQAAWSNFISSVGGGLISKAARGTTDAEEKYGSSVVNLPTITKIDRERHPVASTIGTLAGEAVKYGTATKALSYAAKGGGVAAKLAGKGIGAKLAAGRVIDLPVDLVNAAVETDNAGDFAKRLGIDTAIGIGADLTFEGVGRLFKHLKAIKQAKGAITKEAISETVEKVTKETAENVTETSAKKTPQALPIKQVDDISTFGKNTVGAAQRNPNSYSALQNEYGTIKPGETPFRNVDVPKQTKPDNKVRQGVRTMMESEIVPDSMVSEFENEVAKGAFSYIPISDKRALKYASDTIAQGGTEEAFRIWDGVVSGNAPATKEAIAVGETLLNAAANAGDTKTAMKIAAELAAEGTRAGQTVQAFRLIKKMTPQGQLYYIEKSVKNLQDDIVKRFGDKAPDLKISDDLVDKLLKSRTKDEVEAAGKEIFSDVAKQVPSTWYDKWNAWRYLSMLGNPRTHIRNIVGNTIFVPARKIKNIIGAGLERVSGVPVGKRTKSILNPVKDRNLIDFAKTDFKSAESALTAGEKYLSNTLIDQNKKVFKTKPLEWLRKMNFNALEAEDKWFLGSAYTDSMAQYLKANKLSPNFIQSGTKEASEVLEKARKYAMLEAQKATYRDANSLATALSRASKIKSGDSAAKKIGKLAIEGIVPFKKTPMNIIRRGVEYSPAGLVNGIKQSFYDVAKGTKTTAEAIDTIASGLTGTGIMALGAYLASQGLVSGQKSDNKKEQSFDVMQGSQNYAINIGDKSYTIDWAAPVVLPLFVGVEAWKQLSEDNGITFAEFSDALTNITEPMLNLSMLQGIQGTIKSAGYSESPLADIITGSLTGYIGQAVPTALGQVARTIDDTRRTNYIEPDSSLPRTVDYFVQRTMGKIPGISQTKQPMIDSFGREDKEPSLAMRIFENFLSPGYVSENKSTPVEKEIEKVYKQTGEGLPIAPAKNYTVDGKKYNLSGDEYTKYAKIRGQEILNTLNEVIKDTRYSKLSDEEKAEIINDVYEYGNQAAKDKFAKTRGLPIPDGLIVKAEESKKQNIKISDFILTKHQINPDADDTSETIKKLIPLLPENQRQLATETSDSASDVKRLLIFNKDLTPEQKSTLDKLLVGELKNPRDYSSEDAFILSGLSEAKQKRYPEVKSRWGNITPSEYALILDGIKGLKRKDEIISKLMEIGFSEAGAYRFYNVAIK